MCAAELLRNTFTEVKIMFIFYFILLLELPPLFICEATFVDYEDDADGKSQTFQVKLSTLWIF